MVAIEGLYIFDEHNIAILEHVYNGRPPASDVLLPAYLSHPAPQPAVIYLPNTNPPTLLCSITQDRLLFLCPTSSEVEPLVVLEFLHRVADALEEFLGSPLLASKIGRSYDVVAQIVGEICDAGTVATTEPNALTEMVEAPSWMGNLFGGLGLPASSPAFGTPGSVQASATPFMASVSSNTTLSNTGSAVPWRRANVRHTSNELYVDIIEKLSVVLAPSGRPISAIAMGNIVFTAKISGVPDLLLSLNAPGGKHGIENAMDLPSFHPCVRLARWRERPGELSFVPPDGRFVLAGYECNLLPDLFGSEGGKINSPALDLPIWIETRIAQGLYGDEFEVRLKVKNRFGGYSSSAANSMSSHNAAANRFGGAVSGVSFGGTPASPGLPPIEDIVVTIPIPGAVRNVEDLKASKGEANFLANESMIEWRVSSKEAAAISSAGTTLRCTITGHSQGLEDADGHVNGFGHQQEALDFEEATADGSSGDRNRPAPSRAVSTESRKLQRMQQNAALMPKSATLSFSLRGWLPSGIKVDGLTIDKKTSKGLGAGVTPYKGVKYHTVSQDGIEVRT